MSLTTARARPRVLQLSFACHPDSSMESRLSYQRAVESSKEFDTWVVCHGPLSLRSPQGTCAPWSPHPGLWIVPLETTRWQNFLQQAPGLFYSAYHHFHRRAWHHIRALHRELQFDLVHHVGFCGFREPGYGWKLDVPFLWGPVGGIQNFPVRFLGELDWPGAAFELLRNSLNQIHFRYRDRVRQATRRAAHIWSANSLAVEQFQKIHGVSTDLQLETGVEQIPALKPRCHQPDEPLRILWSGRLVPWKALPLLLKALAQLPSDVRYELRVIGRGNRQRAWMRTAERLGLASRVTWVGWPDYRDSWSHYEWADLFVFTSLRDTSGTGLLEALAHNCPIVALDHQGARDIVTSECGIRVPVETPQQVITGLSDAIAALAREPERLEHLRAGARRRAADYLWTKLGAQMRNTYRQLLDSSPSACEANQLASSPAA